jgi:hypothetical protein
MKRILPGENEKGGHDQGRAKTTKSSGMAREAHSTRTAAASDGEKISD